MEITVCSAPVNILPKSDDFLVLSPAQQAHAYRHVDKLFANRRIKASNPKPMPRADRPVPGDHETDVARLVRDNNAAGVLVIKNNHIVVESYGLGLVENDRWTTMSTVKSMTSLLVGAAIEQGAIKSADSNVVESLPEL